MEEQTHSHPVTSVEAQPVRQQPFAPHRGLAMLVRGIVGLVVALLAWFCCGIFAIAGCICGIISVILAIVIFIILLLVVGLVGLSNFVRQQPM